MTSPSLHDTITSILSTILIYSPSMPMLLNLNLPTIQSLLTKLQCCPTSDGSAAAFLVSEAFLNARLELKSQVIEIVSQCLTTGLPEDIRSGRLATRSVQSFMALRSWASNRHVDTSVAMAHNVPMPKILTITGFRPSERTISSSPMLSTLTRPEDAGHGSEWSHCWTCYCLNNSIRLYLCSSHTYIYALFGSIRPIL